MARERILVVDDEEDIRELIAYNLEKEGYFVSAAKSGEEALSKVLRELPDVVILDLMLPGIDGLEVCRRMKLQEQTRSLPIIMLTAKSEDADVVAGLELGADDYLTKPFSPRVLVAHLHAVLRRAKENDSRAAATLLRIHNITIDVSRHEVTVDSQPVALSATEFAILEHFARSPGWVFSRNRIIDAVKGKDYPVTERSVDVQILGLRKKLGAAGEHIQTIRGVGYRIRAEG
ncbi:response regulator [Salinispira pacifica]